MLLDALQNPCAYIPIDISKEQLALASSDLASSFPNLNIHPVFADYTSEISLPIDSTTGRTVVFFPGSTIGNFTPDEAIDFLRKAATLIGPEGSLLIGFDRVKDSHVLEAAYNDSLGITKEFNLNLINRIRSEFGVPISNEDFDHHAFFNKEKSRIEMHLVGKKAQTLNLDDEEISFAHGEHIVTEYSYKYTSEAFQEILSSSGFEIQDRWSDPKEYFEVCYATVAHK
jgi:dimethylhistidine N-methyltransferase